MTTARIARHGRACISFAKVREVDSRVLTSFRHDRLCLVDVRIDGPNRSYGRPAPYVPGQTGVIETTVP